MQVVLLKSVRKLGKIGDIVTVKDGFGRNFLLPLQYAIRATKENLERFEIEKKEFDKKNAELLTLAQDVASKIEGRDFTFIRQSGSDDRLFGSVSAKEIAAALSSYHKDINYSSVELSSPIKTIGIFPIKIHLYSDIVANIIINVAKSEFEAADALRNFKSESESSSVSESNTETN